MSFFISLSIWLVVGGICFQVAKHRGRNPIIWFFVGFILGVIGLIILYIMPKKEGASSLISSSASAWRRQGNKSPASLVRGEGLCDATYLWYYLDESDQQHGPMSFDALHRAWEGHQITPSTYVWSRGMKEWKSIEEMPALLTKIRDLSSR